VIQELIAEGSETGVFQVYTLQNLLIETLSLVLRSSVRMSVVDTPIKFRATERNELPRDVSNSVQCPVINMTFLESCLLLWCSLVQSAFFRGTEEVRRVPQILGLQASNFPLIEYFAVDIRDQ
jgi:hypothetical protein